MKALFMKEGDPVITPSPISEAKITEIKDLIDTLWLDFYTAEEMASHIMEGYIWGTYGNSEHYTIDLILNLIKEVDLIKNPPAPVEPTPDPLLDNQA